MRVNVPISAMMVGTKRGREAKETLLGNSMVSCDSHAQTRDPMEVTHQPK